MNLLGMGFNALDSAFESQMMQRIPSSFGLANIGKL
jgi:hypothetical protein